VDSDAVGAARHRRARGGTGLRLDGAPCLTDRRDVIDVHKQSGSRHCSHSARGLRFEQTNSQGG
jgi:hypothetical protein